MDFKQIKKEDLIDGRFYLGRGRNGNVGKWNKHYQAFTIHCWKFTTLVEKYEGYYEPASGCFQPFVLIDPPSENKTIEKHRFVDRHEYVDRNGNVARWDKSTQSFLTINEYNIAIQDPSFLPIIEVKMGTIKEKYPEYGDYGKILSIEDALK